MGGVTVITVNTFFNNNGTLVAVPSKVNITGNANGSDTANLYDYAGSNALVAQGNKATLTTTVNTVAVTQFGKVNAFQTAGTATRSPSSPSTSPCRPLAIGRAYRVLHARRFCQAN